MPPFLNISVLLLLRCIYLLFTTSAVVGSTIGIPPRSNNNNNDTDTAAAGPASTPPSANEDFDSLVTARLQVIRRQWPNADPIFVGGFLPRGPQHAGDRASDFTRLNFYFYVPHPRPRMYSTTHDPLPPQSGWSQPRAAGAGYDSPPFSWELRGANLRQIFNALAEANMLSPMIQVSLLCLKRDFLPDPHGPERLYYFVRRQDRNKPVLYIDAQSKRIYPGSWLSSSSSIAANDSAAAIGGVGEGDIDGVGTM